MRTLLAPSAVLLPEGMKKETAVVVRDGLIDAVLPFREAEKQHFDRTEAFPDEILLPGFVNCHHHMYGVLSHGITAETMVTDFSDFLGGYWWPCVENRVDRHLAALTAKWACVEMIRSGVTSFMDILEAPNAIPGGLDAEAAVVEEAGLRGFLSFEATERISEENGRLGLKENRDFARQQKRAGSLVQGMMSVHTLFTCSLAFLLQAKKMSLDAGCMLHMHLSESRYEPDFCLERYGKRPVEMYAELGILDDQVLASQLVKVNEREIALFAEHGAHGASMPISNCEVGGGFAPLPEMVRAGIPMGLGTDGYVNNFFEVMRGAFLMHKARLEDPQTMPAKLVWELATRGGADALGIPAGSISAGRAADLITVRLDTPTPVNAHNVYDQLVLFRNPEHVRNVMAAGKWLEKDGQLLTIDEEKTRAELSAAVKRFWQFHLDQG